MLRFEIKSWKLPGDNNVYSYVLYELCSNVFEILFGEQQITESCYSAVYANQDDDVMKATLADLNRDSPKIRLVLST
jgi:hypothetical protein